jgi:hypothetical protein
MEVEVKWLTIMAACMFIAMFAGMGAESYNRQQCRITAIQASMPAEQIEKVCK